ncbi:MAG: GrdB-related putative oxidoreductase [Paeniclostridium sordellii]|nr:GrdB-related putative oxidoreductase [Paeniclostridium sordellii]
MTKIVLILDQIQAGAGGKEKANIPPGGKKTPLGPGVMMESYLKEVDSKVVASLYCGDEYFINNQEEVTSKMVAMVKKINPDVVVCGPAFNYENFAKMSAILAKSINDNTNIKAFAAMSIENTEILEKYKDEILIVKTPKKGGIGLNESLKNICQMAKKLAENEDISTLRQEVCF